MNKYSEIKTVLYKIFFNIQKSYPLTTVQKLKIYTTIDTNMNYFINNGFNIEEPYSIKTIKSFFNIIIDSDLNNEFNDNNIIKVMFKLRIKTCIVEFFTYKYCISNSIDYKPNGDLILYLMEIINGIPKVYKTNKELETTLIRINIDELLNLSIVSKKLFEDFNNLFKSKQKTKKEM